MMEYLWFVIVSWYGWILFLGSLDRRETFVSASPSGTFDRGN